ncbi:clusterin [Hemicordylus capensis]|uniref:clusterin n=1 Tax=Hemicordylus capensis TaxID=884348 RepID=UPI0023030FBC|nr:clusterin [Hemicordylus capensis]XP_053106156.1 clusterin [Hemicordylus capensis]XP_053106161.1 clusterin [Hemicordylus capensis]XP_053106168.1 clusterin [Hemicordylus capensis]
MTPTLLLLLLGLLSSWERGHCIVPEKLDQLSTTGSRVVDEELENAINGVREMKALMEKTSKDHRDILNNLEETKKKKEEALLLAKETEEQLAEQTEVCNETMLALWEECKPCLKHTCMRLYTRTCHSGASLVGRQLEEFLNRSSPFSIWVNGERVDSLVDVGEQQGQRLDDLEERYGLVEGGVEDLFRESTQAYGRLAPFFQAPFGGLWDAFRSPARTIPLPISRARLARDVPFASLSPSQFPHQDFHQLFQPIAAMTQRLFEGARRGMEQDGQWLQGGLQRPLLGRFSTVISSPDGDRMVCREMRRNSASCLRMRERCEKCQAILDVDCSQTAPDQTRLRERFEDAVRLAERFTRRYDDLLKTFQEEMFNFTSHIDELQEHFGWVSRLANLTRGTDRPLRVTMVSTSSSNSTKPEDLSQSTQVTVQLFGSDPVSITMPEGISPDDSKFMETVVEEVLRQYKENNVE